MQNDELILLLSTDCFFRYWSTLGFNLAEASKRKLQKKCRTIVKQIMSGVCEPNYYLTAFSKERLEETDRLFEKAVSECSASESSLIFARMAKRRGRKNEDFAFLWTLTVGTALGQFEEGGLLLSEQINSVLIRSYEDFGDFENNFASELSNSTTDWDLYIKALTPNSPLNLAAYVAQAWQPQTQFDQFWLRVCSELTADQVLELEIYFTDLAFSLTGQRLDLSSLGQSS